MYSLTKNMGSLAVAILFVLIFSFSLLGLPQAFAEASGEGGLESEKPSPWLKGEKRDDPARLLDRFSQIDSDHDGYITFEEWNGSRASFNQLDNNGDGVIDRGEFLGLGTGGRE